MALSLLYLSSRFEFPTILQGRTHQMARSHRQVYLMRVQCWLPAPAGLPKGVPLLLKPGPSRQGPCTTGREMDKGCLQVGGAQTLVKQVRHKEAWLRMRLDLDSSRGGKAITQPPTLTSQDPFSSHTAGAGLSCGKAQGTGQRFVQDFLFWT